jgi:alcohol dehydrogenase, propanol-preferring
MRAAILHAAGQGLHIVERERPTPGVGQVLVQVRACGICHADLSLALGHLPFARYPTIPGHEIAGIIEELGPAVSWPPVGTRVGIPWLYSSCGHCEQCVRGKEILCPQAQMTGVTVDGGYQEYMVAPAAYVAPLPDELDDIHAAPLMDAGLTVFNGLMQAGFVPGDKVAVIGFGGLGHLAVRFAQAMGARVAVISRSHETEALARQSGAEHFIATAETDAGAALQQWAGGADIILNTASATEQANQAISGLAPDGTLVILGFGATPLTVAPGVLVGGRKKIMGSPSGSRQDLRKALNFAAVHRILPDVTTVRLEQVADVFTRLEQGTMRGRAVLVFDEGLVKSTS